MPAVIAMASAPQNPTRKAPLHTFAPPTAAANMPSAIKKASLHKVRKVIFNSLNPLASLKEEYHQ